MDTDERELYLPRIENLKTQGRTDKAEIIRDILMDMPPKDIIPLKDGQATAWGKHEAGHYSKAMLDKTRKSMYQYYGLLYKYQKGTKHELQITPLGSEFLSWILSNMEWGSGARKPVKAKASPREDNPQVATGPVVYDTGLPKGMRLEGYDELLVAHVPAGVDIVWVEILEDGKKKAHKIPLSSSLTPPEEMSEVEKLKARLRELGEDI